MDFNWFSRNATEKNQFLVKLPYCKVLVRRVDRIQFTSKAAVKTDVENKVMSRLFLFWLNFCKTWQILIALKFFSRSQFPWRGTAVKVFWKNKNLLYYLF